MPAFIRPLSAADLDGCAAIESAVFPPAEAATREKIEYRLSTCPEICYGLFLLTPEDTLPDPTALPVHSGPVRANEEGGVLLAHIISTKSIAPVVTDQDMMLPLDWKSNPKAVTGVGHQPNGKTIALHSLAVSPAHQRSGLGRALMKQFIEELEKMGEVERISILTYDRLVPYYQKLGFQLLGESASNFGGVPWKDMTYTFAREHVSTDCM
ncbi:hypothetical protein QQS21_001704 [Conoideocrella luteorostrata]|uniref:N-acetyltransferase domain-containing protein n=1 Tax=Conoideocrella luteorostrata TaxID=1105319 RepID=A0AAJ0CZM7_9HYPO|nr:hypothetical protein QQS21_001704 [Conoideocrella luteorostrata]